MIDPQDQSNKPANQVLAAAEDPLPRVGGGEQSAHRESVTLDTATVQSALARFRADAPTLDQPHQLLQQLRALIETYFANDPSRNVTEQILASVLGDNPSEILTSQQDGRDRVFAQNLLRFRSYATQSSAPASVRRSSRDEDCLADGWDAWSIFRVVNLAAMASIPVCKRAAIVTSVRNEGVSILEWLAHHRSIGFDTFYVYTNDNTDLSDNLLRILAAHGIIILIENEVGTGVRVQEKVLEHSLHLLPDLRQFEWAFYIDVDEFFISRCEPDLTLDSYFSHFLKSFPSGSPSAVCFNWKWFGSENAFRKSEGLLLERFTYSIHNEHVKSLVRLQDTISMRRVHVPALLEGAWLVDSTFNRVDATTQMRPTYGAGQLNHYWNKSFEEFILKRSRGRISEGLGGKPLDFSSFFDWGANGRRGDFDPPEARVLERVKREYDILVGIPGVEDMLRVINVRWDEMLSQLDTEWDISGIYRRQGQPEIN